jgi:hypothetical protein
MDGSDKLYTHDTLFPGSLPASNKRLGALSQAGCLGEEKTLIPSEKQTMIRPLHSPQCSHYPEHTMSFI